MENICHIVHKKGEGGLNFCHFGACILLTDPFRLVVFILNEVGFAIWTFFHRENPVLFLWSKSSW